jgi:hypothetical protein
MPSRHIPFHRFIRGKAEVCSSWRRTLVPPPCGEGLGRGFDDRWIPYRFRQAARTAAIGFTFWFMRNRLFGS